MALWDSLISPIIGQVSNLVAQFHLSPEQKQQFDAQMAQLQQSAQQQANDYEVKLNDIAGQNIRAEADSGDNYTRRARPSVIWFGLLFILWDYCVLPTLVTLDTHLRLPEVLLPQWFWEVWGVVVTGYVFARSTEKISSIPGDSQISLPFLKIGNKN